ncbi:MAG: stage II sporulation protein M [Kiritimatiellae bacterium]|nr:stage II sporulation protein M [Kiritimatiellia bacterium]
MDLPRFVERRRTLWREFEQRIAEVADAPFRRLELDDLRRLLTLYEEVAADLADVRDFGGESELRTYLEALVARAHAEIHALREPAVRWRPGRWLGEGLAATIRRRWRAGTAAAAIFVAGAIFGAAALISDPAARRHLLPFEHLRMPPAERVEIEQREMMRPGGGEREYRTFAAYLWVNNVRVAVLLLALGMTFGAGTAVVLALNGMLLGAVAADYVVAGQSQFLLGWLLPHGAVEIPAILLAAQGGLVLGGALLGAEGPRHRPLAERLGAVRGDVLSLIGGAALLLAWAAGVESFLSQHHEPRLPYTIKIAIGLLELGALALYVARAGSGSTETTAQ